MRFFKKSEPKPENKDVRDVIDGLKANQNALLAKKDANIKECENCNERLEEIRERMRMFPNSRNMYRSSARCIFHQKNC